MIRQNKKDIVDSELERIVSDIKDLLNKGNDKKVNEIETNMGSVPQKKNQSTL